MPEDTKSMIDVSPPGQAPASASGRPIIVTNHSTVQDPMMAPEPVVTPAQLTDESPAAGIGAIGSVIAPGAPSTPDAPAEPEAPPEPAVPSPSDDDEPKAKLVHDKAYSGHMSKKGSRLLTKVFIFLGCIIILGLVVFLLVWLKSK